MNSSSAREKTFPVGLLGVLRMMALVCGPKAAASSLSSKVQSGGWKFDEARSGAGKNRVGSVVFVERFEDNDFVAGIDDGHHGGHHGFGGTAADGDFALGIVGNVLGAGEFFDDGVAERLGAPSDGVLIDVVGDGLAGGFLHFLGGGKIGKTLRKIHGVVLHGQARHFADDGFGELFGLGGEHAARDVRHVGFGCGHG